MRLRLHYNNISSIKNFKYRSGASINEVQGQIEVPPGMLGDLPVWRVTSGSTKVRVRSLPLNFDFSVDWFRRISDLWKAVVGRLAITQPPRIARSLLSFVSFSVEPGKVESAL